MEGPMAAKGSQLARLPAPGESRQDTGRPDRQVADVEGSYGERSHLDQLPGPATTRTASEEPLYRHGATDRKQRE